MDNNNKVEIINKLQVEKNRLEVFTHKVGRVEIESQTDKLSLERINEVYTSQYIE